MEATDTGKAAQTELGPDDGSESDKVLAAPLKLKINPEPNASTVEPTSDWPSQHDHQPLLSADASETDHDGISCTCCAGASNSSFQDGLQDTDAILEFDLQDVDSQALLALNEELEKILDPKNTLCTPPPNIDLSPLECHALQQEELETLRAIYDRDLTPLNDNCTCFMVRITFLSEEIKEEDIIRIWFSLPPNYPCVPPVFEIEANRSGSFTYRDADELFDLLMAESINRIGGMMVFDLVTIAQDYMPELVERRCQKSAQQAAQDLERKHTMELEQAVQHAVKSRGVPRELWEVLIQDSAVEQKKATPTQDEEAEAGAQSYSGVYKPAEFVGPISEIIKRLPEGLQITRIENILRQDLAARFRQSCDSATKSLWSKERKLPQMYNLRPQIAFHGTLTKSLPSIVHRGLMIPGVGNKLSVRCGSSLGLGIYLSPSAEFSLAYSDTNRLIVCAALQGRVFKGNYLSLLRSKERHHSIHCFVSSCGNEWVFFSASQVLPCYVIQVDRKQKGAYNPPPLASLQEGSHGEQPGESQTEREKKAKLLSRARKFLPYGFGPGGKTVIEDAASFDDDEEDYGDYQMLRHAAKGEDDLLSVAGSGVVQETSDLQKYRFRDLYSRTESIEQK